MIIRLKLMILVFLIWNPLLYSQDYTIENYLTSVNDTFYIFYDINKTEQTNISKKVSNHISRLLPERKIVEINLLELNSESAINYLNEKKGVLIGEIKPETNVWESFNLLHLHTPKKYYQNLPDSGYITTLSFSPNKRNKILVIGGNLQNLPNFTKQPIKIDYSYTFNIGHKEIKKGILTYELIPKVNKINASKSTEDFNYLCNILEEVHPNLLFNRIPDLYIKNKKEIRDSITSLAEQDQLYSSNYFMLIKEFVAQFGDGHTSIHIGNNFENILYHKPEKVNLPPFLLNYSNDKITIASTSIGYEHLKNHEVVSINGIPIFKIFRKIFKDHFW
jgi:hypothetical protein